jgi:choline dehydrogenase-like flavoprotein
MQIPIPQPEDYDVVVLGSGEAGKYIAWTLAKKGMRAIVILEAAPLARLYLCHE